MRGRGVCAPSAPALQTVLAEAQHGREVADVADGQSQRLDLGQALASRRHRRRQEAAQFMQRAGERAHAQLLPLAGALPLPSCRRGARTSGRRRGGLGFARAVGQARGLRGPAGDVAGTRSG